VRSTQKLSKIGKEKESELPYGSGFIRILPDP
jgi:hypothetical protein